MQADIVEKQNYLYKEIIEAGYNPEVFQEYLLSKNETAQDLSSWHFPDLRKVVQQFKAMQDQQFKNEQQQQKAQQHEEPQILSPTKSSNSNSRVQYNEQQQSEIIIFCDKFIESKLTEHANPRVEINDFTKKEGGIFQKAFVLYIINTPCLKAIVQRRFSDFQWLKNILEIHHPGLPIPPLPKKGHSRRFDDKHIQKRMMLFQMFLNKLLMIPQLKADEILEKFLTIETSSELQKYKSSLKKITNVPLKKMRTADGKLHLTNDQNIREINSKILKHYQSIQPDTKRVYKQFKAAATMMQGSATHLKNISMIFKQLAAKQKKFCEESKIQIQQNTYMSIFQFMTQKLASLLKDQAQSFRKELWCTMKYESLTMLSFIDSITKLNSLQSQYSHKKVNLQRKKIRLFEQGNMKNWQLPQSVFKTLTTKPAKQQAFNIMLPKQSKQLRGSWQKLSLFNTEIHKQFIRNYKERNDYLSSQLKKFTQSNARISNLSMIMWANVDSKISGLAKRNKYHVEQTSTKT